MLCPKELWTLSIWISLSNALSFLDDCQRERWKKPLQHKNQSHGTRCRVQYCWSLFTIETTDKTLISRGREQKCIMKKNISARSMRGSNAISDKRGRRNKRRWPNSLNATFNWRNNVSFPAYTTTKTNKTKARPNHANISLVHLEVRC